MRAGDRVEVNGVWYFFDRISAALWNASQTVWAGHDIAVELHCDGIGCRREFSVEQLREALEASRNGHQ